MPYLVPSTTEEALSLLESGHPKVIAGCTDYYPGLKAGQSDDSLLDISRIADLRGITKTDGGWRFGAATTWTDILRAPLPAAFDGLKQSAREVGSVQIQNRGTVAGNICNASPAADGVPPLLSLGATVEVASALGSRIVPLCDFITGVRQTDLRRGEMVLAVHIPAQPDTARSAFLKLGSRTHLVISIAMVACVIDLDGDAISSARIAVGSCSPIAQRLPDLERVLISRTLHDVATVDFNTPDAFAPLSPISDIRGSAGYRSDVVARLCKRAVLTAVREG